MTENSRRFDKYTKFAAEKFNVPVEKVTARQRQLAEAMWMIKHYSIGPTRISTIPPIKNDPEDVRKMMETLGYTKENIAKIKEMYKGVKHTLEEKNRSPEPRNSETPI